MLTPESKPRTGRKRISPRTIAAIIWISALLLLSMLPLGMKQHLHTTGALHRWGHLILFIVTGALLCARRSVRDKFLFLAITVLIGFSLEWLENKVWHNGLEWHDVRTDTVGACVGAGITLLDKRRG